MTAQQVLQSNTDRWMMIPNSGVDLGGTVCNKVGTSYIAFRYGQAVSELHTTGVEASLTHLQLYSSRYCTAAVRGTLLMKSAMLASE